MSKHVLKCWPEFFQAALTGVKSFEVRVNDRNYQVGDILNLNEYDPDKDTYTGRWVSRKVTYIVHGGKCGLPENLVLMAIV